LGVELDGNDNSEVNLFAVVLLLGLKEENVLLVGSELLVVYVRVGVIVSIVDIEIDGGVVDALGFTEVFLNSCLVSLADSARLIVHVPHQF